MELDYKGLKEYLLSFKKEDFENGKVLKAHTISDIKKNGVNEIMAAEQVVDYGEYFLVDILGNDLTVVQLTRRKYKIPDGRTVQCKIIKSIISDCRKEYGTPLNDCWVIPKQFIEEELK